MRLAICDVLALYINRCEKVAYFSETLCLSMLLKTEGWEVNTRSEDLGLCEDRNAADTIDLHLHVWVTIWVSEVGQMWAPSGVLGVTLDNNGVLIKSVRERDRKSVV